MARFFFAHCAGPSDGLPKTMPFVDFEGLRRPKSPNTCLVAPQELTSRARVDKPSPDFAVSPETLFARVEAYVSAQKNTRDLTADSTQLALNYVSVTSLMRFKDDVDVRVLRVPGQPDAARIAMYSRSRVGHSDLGANARRVDKLIAAISVG